MDNNERKCLQDKTQRNLRINHSDISIDRRQEGGRETTIKAQY